MFSPQFHWSGLPLPSTAMSQRLQIERRRPPTRSTKPFQRGQSAALRGWVGEGRHGVGRGVKHGKRGVGVEIRCGAHYGSLYNCRQVITWKRGFSEWAEGNASVIAYSRAG